MENERLVMSLYLPLNYAGYERPDVASKIWKCPITARNLSYMKSKMVQMIKYVDKLTRFCFLLFILQRSVQ